MSDCKNKKCGCQDTMLTSPAPCPTPAGCANPEPCSAVYDAQCVVYTGDPIICDKNTLVPINTNLAEALNDIVDYFCNNSGGSSMTSTITCGIQDYPATVIVNSGTSYNDAIVAVSNYYCDQINNILNNPSCPPQVRIVRNQNGSLTATASGGTGSFDFKWEFSSAVNGILNMYNIDTIGTSPTTSNMSFSIIGPTPGIGPAQTANGYDMYIGLAKVEATDTAGCVAKDTYLVIDLIANG